MDVVAALLCDQKLRRWVLCDRYSEALTMVSTTELSPSMSKVLTMNLGIRHKHLS
jgi:hypothetical protein